MIELLVDEQHPTSTGTDQYLPKHGLSARRVLLTMPVSVDIPKMPLAPCLDPLPSSNANVALALPAPCPPSLLILVY